MHAHVCTSSYNGFSIMQGTSKRDNDMVVATTLVNCERYLRVATVKKRIPSVHTCQGVYLHSQCAVVVNYV